MSDSDQKVLERSDITTLIETATKPVLDLLEASVLRALGVVTGTVDGGLTEEEVDHVEASIYEEVVVTCAGRIVQIAADLRKKGDTVRADLIHLSLAGALRETGLRTGDVDEPNEDQEETP